MLATILTWAPPLIVAAVASWLPKYLETRVTEAARGSVDVSVGKKLSEYQLAIDKQLESHRHELSAGLENVRQSYSLDRERYSRDYGLFATRRNEVYAESFALFEKARGAYGKKFAKLLSFQDFSRSPAADLARLADRLELVSEGERLQLRSHLEAGDLEQARTHAGVIYERDELRRANRSFSDFRNACALNALYFSTEVLETVRSATRPLATLSVNSDAIIANSEEQGLNGYAEVAELDALSVRLRDLMRGEMHSGFNPK